jgi:hypothetical protein
MALHLGLTYGDGPGWFHSLPRQEQIKVMAYHRITTEPPRSKRPAELKPGVSVADEAQAFWLGS